MGKENQYIPEFYLNNFSIKNKNQEIGVFNVDTEEYLPKVEIKTQIQNPYFFGKGCIIEEWLENVETTTELCFTDIIFCNAIPQFSRRYFKNITYYVLLFELRNPLEAKSVDKALSDLLSEIPFEGKEFSDFKSSYDIPKGINFSVLDKSLDCLKDLKTKLIINKTNVPFLTSDRPVIKYNQLLRNLNFEGDSTNYGAKGLQLMIPLSPNHLLFFYDNKVYKVGDAGEPRVFIENESDIKQLNALMLLNAQESVYFNENTDNKCISELKELFIENIKGKSFKNEIRNGLNLSFVKIKSSAQKIKINSKSSPKRDEALSNMKYWC